MVPSYIDSNKLIAGGMDIKLVKKMLRQEIKKLENNKEEYFHVINDLTYRNEAQE